mmetsp:Transcript_23495/g.65357  ORF Transcript_23495/g.65357 Transcript_23495/m.65357 type:complete len:316 (+) Transcript_23495:322-1269(+)
MGDDSETQDQMESRHKKELKALEGEQRAATKKAKALKGKKGKEALATVEKDYAQKTQDLRQRQQSELEQLSSSGGNADDAEAAEPATASSQPQTSNNNEATTTQEEPPAIVDKEEEARQRKLEKARRKRESKKEKERQRQEAIAAETAAAGPTARDIENAQLRATLQPLKLTIRDVAADGNCLYRAVAAQLQESPSNHTTTSGYVEVRALCADALEQNSNEFSPFCEYTEAIPDFASYVQRVRNSADWGGHLELRALALAVQRPIHVYSTANGAQAMVIEGGGSSTSDDVEPIRLSYHLHYYALGEHYNEVIPLE